MLELSAVRAFGEHQRWRSGSGARGGLMQTLDEAFEALADPIRRSLVQTLASGPLPAGTLAAPFDVSRPAVSRHLRVLREAGLVEVERRGRERLYRLSEGPLEEVRRWVADVAAMWDEALAAFKQHAEVRR